MAGSTVSGNAVRGSFANSGGGGIMALGNSSIFNSTIANNHSSIDGGGFETFNNATIFLGQDTLYQNSAVGAGGNIDNPYQLELLNSIVAGGSAAVGPDIANAGTLASGDYNIIQTAVAGNGLSGTTTHNLQVNPALLALTNNGGPTFTAADQSASPGRAHIPFVALACGSLGVPYTVDQRGFARGTGGFCDVGAYEFAATPTAARHHTLGLRH
jgi:hypothetical protein